MSNNCRPDPFRDLFDDKELSSLFDDDQDDLVDVDENGAMICPGCAGNGRYVGLFEVEDPCQECGGTGTVRRQARDETRRLPAGG